MDASPISCEGAKWMRVSMIENSPYLFFTRRTPSRRTGKDVSKMPVFVEQYVVVGGDAELKEAAEFWRFGPKAWNPYYNIHDPKEIEQRAEAEIPLEKVFEGWPVGTDPSAHIKTLKELFESGATQVHIHAGQKDQRQVIDFYGREVISKMKVLRSVA
jgi:hypothetical protein